MDALRNSDLYELLEIESTATEKEIKSAYRKKALSCHPDKNPDNPQAAERFQELSKALEILTDEAAKLAYDKLLRARKQNKVRHEQLDLKRRKLKDDLEARERAAREEVISTEDAEKKLQNEIERIRKEGSRKLLEETMLLKKQMEEKLVKCFDEDTKKPRLKVTWKASKKDSNNGGYNSDILTEAFRKYGELSCLVLGKKGGSALVEFVSTAAALLSVQQEKGIPENPLSVMWVQGQPTSSTVTVDFTSTTDSKNNPTLVNQTDYESLVLTRLRQAEERKRLITEMEKEDV